VGTTGDNIGSPGSWADRSRETGMSGIALDPDFEHNRYIYLYYTPLVQSDEPSEKYVFRIARYTIDKTTNTIDRYSERILMDIPMIPKLDPPITVPPCCHSGGAMAFDDYGDLWIGVGDQAEFKCSDGSDYKGDFLNQKRASCSGEWGPSNTKSKLGSILRIHPDESDPRGYTIPKGNFGEYWADQYPDRKAEFLDTNLVDPELFSKGLRNPYTLTLDPVRQWVTWGDCGPDGPRNDIQLTEEHNLRTYPAFEGWPYVGGINTNTGDFEHFYDTKTWTIDPEKPMNSSPFNTGIELLPPATKAIYNRTRMCAMTGPIYRYDPNLESDVKFPPHFNRKWFITEFKDNWIRLLELDDEGSEVLSDEEVFTKISLHRPLDFDVGPDGALYILNYGGKIHSVDMNSGISRIEYTGNCRPTDVPFTLEKVGCMDVNDSAYDKDATHHDSTKCVSVLSADFSIKGAIGGFIIDGLSVVINLSGSYKMQIRDISGKIMLAIQGQGKQTYEIPEFNQAGIYFVTVKSENGSFTKKIYKD